MTEALAEAKEAFALGEIPVGALIACDGQIIARAYNTRECDKNPLNHAEIRVLTRAAAQKSDWRLNDCTLYVTLEPCPMCLGALFQARVGRLVIGCFDPKRSPETTSATRNVFPSLEPRLNGEQPIVLASNNHNLEVYGGVFAAESAQLLKEFFKLRRQGVGE